MASATGATATAPPLTASPPSRKPASGRPSCRATTPTPGPAPGSLDDNEIDNPFAEHKRTDFEDLRDFALDSRPGTGSASILGDLARCFKYWIALTDCDGFRIDTLKHVSFDQARNFCGTIKEFAANLGKENFFLVGEIAGGDDAPSSRYLDVRRSQS